MKQQDKLLGEILYDLGYSGESRAMERWLVETIARLPTRVRRFALEQCHFTSVGAVFGLTIPGRVGVSGVIPANRAATKWALPVPEGRKAVVLRPAWVIVLSDELPPKDAHGIIAHEIAHAWRGDDRLGNVPEDCEEQGANLTRAWGFTGKGANAKYCRLRLLRKGGGIHRTK